MEPPIAEPADVASALGRAPGEWRAARLSRVGPNGEGGVWRLMGADWSLVLKVVVRHARADLVDDPKHFFFWRREPVAYVAGLLDELAGMRAPRCHRVEERPDGSYRLWLEDVADGLGGGWTLERYALAARHLGRFGGAYLAGRWLPDHPWLSSGLQPLWRGESADPFPTLRQETWGDPRARAVLPVRTIERVRATWDDRGTLEQLVAAAPMTLCHHDAFRAKMAADGDATVLFDWEYVGLGALGEDPAHGGRSDGRVPRRRARRPRRGGLRGLRRRAGRRRLAGRRARGPARLLRARGAPLADPSSPLGCLRGHRGRTRRAGPVRGVAGDAGRARRAAPGRPDGVAARLRRRGARLAARSRRGPLYRLAQGNLHAQRHHPLLDARGFERRDWRNLRFERSLAEEPPRPKPPDGFALRSLAGAGEVPAYVAVHRAAFNSAYMTDAWRLRTLAAPGHHPDLDLVATAPGGRVVAVAIVWLGPDGEGQFEPVATHPDFQRRGLARALLLEGMRRLRVFGATRAVVETDEGRRAAPELYGSLMERAPFTALPYAARI